MKVDYRNNVDPEATLPGDQQCVAGRCASQPADDRVTIFTRSRVSESVSWCAQRLAVGLNSLLGRRTGESFGILAYHRVVEKPTGVASPTNNVTPRRLRTQLQGLLSRGFQAWPLPRVLEAYCKSRPVPPNVFVVTFDDGFENNLLYGLPILEELGVAATIFLTTAFLDSDQPFPFDNWSAAGSARVAPSSWRPLSTAQCRELLAHELIDLGAHTHTHAAFVGRVDDFRRDLSISVGVMRDRFGISRPTFAFPYGLTTGELIEAARDVGVACALSTRCERICASSDPFHWGRFCTDDLDTAATLAAKLNGWYTPLADALRTMKRPIAAITPGGLGQMVTRSPSNRSVDGIGSWPKGELNHATASLES